MKFFLILLTTVLLISNLTYGQKDDMKPALVTVTAGWSYADINQGDNSTDKRNGFFAGVRKDIKLFPTLHLETGALYVQKGATFDLGEFGDDIEYELDYIDIPLALKLKIGGLYGIAGVSGNIRIKSEIEGEKVDDIKSFAFSSSLGLGFKLLMFSIDFRWNHTLGDIVKDNPDDPIYNSYFLVGLGFSFHKK